jgi:hypothetical protein
MATALCYSHLLGDTYVNFVEYGKGVVIEESKMKSLAHINIELATPINIELATPIAHDDTLMLSMHLALLPLS